MPSLEEQKRALRAEVRARMPKSGSPEMVAMSVAAQQRLAAAAVASGAQVIALYRALPSECGTASLAAELQVARRAVCYPVVTPGDRVLRFRKSAGVFVAGALGIEEPTGAPVALAEIDLLVVPAIAADAKGRRIGRGKGYYDATLAEYRGSSVALLFESQLVPEVPVGEHDRRVGALCTEARWIACV
jgi:5-formyltetrahydrofolate cyclo-ligase